MTIVKCTVCSIPKVPVSVQNWDITIFVCQSCRCSDCQAVFNVVCDCGETHTKRSKLEAGVCEDCMQIRARIVNLDPTLASLRYDSDFSIDEPLY